MMVPCRVVLDMEGTAQECMVHLRVLRRYVGENQDTGPVLPSLDGDTHRMECGVASWGVWHRHGRHVIPSARWPVGTPVSSLRRPSPSRVPAGTDYEEPISFHIQALAVARLTILNHQTLRSVGRIPNWAGRTITPRILHPRRGKLSTLQHCCRCRYYCVYTEPVFSDRGASIS